jgi:hypothetical protein
MPLDERMAVLERVVEDGFKGVNSRLDGTMAAVTTIDTKVDAGFQDVHTRVTTLELRQATQQGFVKALAWLMTIPAVLGSLAGLILAIRAV